MKNIHIKATLPQPIQTATIRFSLSYPKSGSCSLDLTPYGDYLLHVDESNTEGAVRRTAEYKAAYNKVTMAMCAHLSPCICTYRHVPNNPKKPRYLHWHMKIPWLVNKDAFMRQRRRLPKIRLIDLDNWQLYPHLVHPYISQDSVEDRFICSIEREMFFLLLVRIDYKAFDGQGSFFIKTKK